MAKTEFFVRKFVTRAPDGGEVKVPKILAEISPWVDYNEMNCVHPVSHM